MKRFVISVVARLAYWFGIDALFYRLNRRAKRVLTFHNVMPDSLFDANTTALSDSETGFRRKVKLLKKRWRFSVDLNDPSTLTITFDDGFVNECEVAGRILDEEGHIPAILFAITGLVGRSNPMEAPVVDLLMHWNACVPDGAYPVGVNGEMVAFTKDNRFETWVRHVRPAYAADGANMGRSALSRCDASYSITTILSGFPMEYLRLRLTGVTNDQIASLRIRGWKVGSHSANHFVFSSLTTDQKRSELVAPEYMKDVVFSYPYGENASIDNETVQLTEEAGYLGAVCNLPDGGGRVGRYFLPRMALPDDPYLIHFELSGLKTFLKTGRLLPVVRL